VTRLSLTFDNGPNPGTTERILRTLAERQLTATFFMVGERLLTDAGRETARRVREAGHRIGNHTMTHGPPLGDGADRARVEAEVGGAQRVLAEVGVRDLLFRPNGRGRLGPHLLSPAAVDYLVDCGYTVVTWNCVPRDWEKPPDRWLARAHKALSEQEWTVLVLHDVHPAAVDHLPGFLDAAIRDGAEVRQDFPTSCVPMRDGVVQWPIEGVVTTGTARRQIKPG
jgi:peptidoglycan/xylan/chitin deacetylase (PgdA/CDA1 family)